MAKGKSAFDVQADGRAATIATSDALIRGNKGDIITAMRQDLAVIDGGRLLGYGLRMRAADLAGRAMRLRQLIDKETEGE